MKDSKLPPSIPFPGKAAMTEYMSPAQDKQGHSAVIHFRVPPGQVREVEKLMTFKDNFGWETHSDFYRWCVRFGFEHAAKKTGDKMLQNYGSQRKAVEEATVTEQMHAGFKKDLERIENTVRMLEEGGDREPMVRMLTAIEGHIKNIDNDYWRKKWQKEFKQRFGRHVRPVSLTEFNQDEDENE